MPIYEYACKSCGQQFEEFLRTTKGADEATCPKCGSTETARALSVFAAVSSDGGAKSESLPPGMCGRCGGPGPCATG